ncbi:hypothetical protein QC761_405840 [Podospora bellae-mahoneyi]|uniref:Uncharacterized protein n=1 Tax=Podospora bellae-mahoneyi TaxID=2093777 RepID=A0ABR0FJ34_9PEZI|nr:hypothetical protein QC761_405840 [Podospora bellae-mahoneyi]
MSPLILTRASVLQHDQLQLNVLKTMSFLSPRRLKRKKWESPELLCGEIIDTPRVGLLKKAWGSSGPAQERFDVHILPDIEDVLRNIDPGYADIFVRLYMT